MNTKAFLSLLVWVLVGGGTIGGAFVGGMALGKNQGEGAAQSGVEVQSTTSLGQQSSSQRNPQSLEELRQRFQSGELSQEELGQLRQQFQGGQFGPSAGRQGFAGRAGLTGTIEKIEGATVTVNTSQGMLQATIGADTIIQMFTEGTLADLLAGMQVTVNGERGEDGTVEARSIRIIPEGEDGFFDGGFFSDGRQRQ